MPRSIYLTGVEAATNADILNNTRLSSIPFLGTLTFQCLSNLNNGTNRFSVTIQLPGGDVPVDSQFVSAGQEVEGALGGQLDDRLLDMWQFPSGLGGHFTISFTETGTAVVTWRCVLVGP